MRLQPAEFSGVSEGDLKKRCKMPVVDDFEAGFFASPGLGEHAFVVHGFSFFNPFNAKSPGRVAPYSVNIVNHAAFSDSKRE